MAPRKKKEAVVLLLDVGSNTNRKDAEERTFFSLAKECVSMIIQRKLFSASADKLCLILFGSDDTKNKLAKEIGGYEHIKVVTRLVPATWDLLRFVEKLESPSNTVGDWLDAIIVALDYMRRETDDEEFAERKIVLLSNFVEAVSSDQVDAVINGLQKNDFQLLVIGPDINSDTKDALKKSESQMLGENLISRVAAKLNGKICSFEGALPQLMYFQRKGVTPTPWNADLVMSEKIRIPISAYKKVAEPAPIKWLNEPVDDETATVEKERTYMRYDPQKGVDIETDKKDIVDAYKFGGTLVPFSDVDKEAMTYKSGQKGLYFLGCAKKEQVPLHMLVGFGNYIVTNRKGDNAGKEAVHALVIKLAKQDKDGTSSKVGIAVKIYRDNSAPALGALYPVLTDESAYLVFVELPYSEDQRRYYFPSLSKLPQRSEQQKMVVSDLLHDLDLDSNDDDEEYNPVNVYDPYEQYQYHCMTFKALHPDDELPDNLKEKVKHMMEPHARLKNKIDLYAPRIKQLFHIKEELKNEDVQTKVGANEENQEDKVEHISLEQPDKDFLILLRKGKPLLDLCREMQQRIVSIILSLAAADEDVAGTQKLCCALKVLRDASLTSKEIHMFNQWIQLLKEFIVEKSKTDIWKNIVSERLGVITKMESESSNVTLEEAERFYQLKAEHDNDEDEDEDEDDMWNDL